MYDKSLIVKRFSKSYEQYNQLAVVQQKIALQLSHAIQKYIVKTPEIGVEIGSGTGFLTNELFAQFPYCQWLINDISEESRKYLPANTNFVAQDAETLEFPNNLDILISASTAQWFNDLKGFIQRTHSSLADSGIVAISTFGTSNFKEITATTDNTLNYMTINELSACFDGYEILETRIWEEVLTFATPLEVLHHIKATGLNAISGERWTKSRLQEFCSDYLVKFGQATLTFNPIIIIARKA